MRRSCSHRFDASSAWSSRRGWTSYGHDYGLGGRDVEYHRAQLEERETAEEHGHRLSRQTCEVDTVDAAGRA